MICLSLTELPSVFAIFHRPLVPINHGSESSFEVAQLPNLSFLFSCGRWPSHRRPNTAPQSSWWLYSQAFLVRRRFATVICVAISSSNHDIAISQLEECLSDLHIWFCINGLALNPDNTDAILHSTNQHAKSLPPLTTIYVAGTSVLLSENIKIFGVVLDNKLSFNLLFSNLSVMCLPYLGSSTFIQLLLILFDIFIQLLPTTSPKPSSTHWLVAASTMPTSYFLVYRQKILDGFIEFKALWHESLYNVDESASQRCSGTYISFLSNIASISRWQHSRTRFYSLVLVVDNQY